MERVTGETAGLVKKTRIVAARRVPVEAEVVDTGVALVADPRRTEEDREEEPDPIAARDQEDKHARTHVARNQPANPSHTQPPHPQRISTRNTAKPTTKPETRSVHAHNISVGRTQHGKEERPRMDVYVGQRTVITHTTHTFT